MWGTSRSGSAAPSRVPSPLSCSLIHSWLGTLSLLPTLGQDKPKPEWSQQLGEMA